MYVCINFYKNVDKYEFIIKNKLCLNNIYI